MTLEAKTSRAQMDTPGVELKSVVLMEQHFRHDGSRIDLTADHHPFQVGLSALRFGYSDLGVEITVGIEVGDALTFSIRYQTSFSVVRDVDSDEHMVALMRSVAARLAPVVVYPYVRAHFNQLVADAGLGNLLLPVVLIGGAYDPDKIVIQEPLDSHEDEERDSTERPYEEES